MFSNSVVWPRCSLLSTLFQQFCQDVSLLKVRISSLCTLITQALFHTKVNIAWQHNFSTTATLWERTPENLTCAGELQERGEQAAQLTADSRGAAAIHHACRLLPSAQKKRCSSQSVSSPTCPAPGPWLRGRGRTVRSQSPAVPRRGVRCCCQAPHQMRRQQQRQQQQHGAGAGDHGPHPRAHPPSGGPASPGCRGCSVASAGIR